MPKHFMRHSSQVALNTWIRQDQKDDLGEIKRFIGKTEADQVREALSFYYGLFRSDLLGDGHSPEEDDSSRFFEQGGARRCGIGRENNPFASQLVVLNTWTYKHHKAWAKRVVELTGKTLAKQVREALDIYLLQCEREGLLGRVPPRR